MKSSSAFTICRVRFPRERSGSATRPYARPPRLRGRVESLSIGETDRRLAQLADVRGTGSAARRAEQLEDLFSRSTRDEQQFLLRLMIGELRQGALAGVMIDAIAAAAELPVAEVRRAAMYGKGLGEVASAAFSGGSEALGKFQLEIFSPVSPMLAQTAADVAEALAALGGPVAFEWKMDGAHSTAQARR